MESKKGDTMKRAENSWTVFETINCGKRGCRACRVNRSAAGIPLSKAQARISELREREPSNSFVLARG